MKSSEGKSASHSHVGRYALFDVIATGGMASVYLGRLDGAVGFSRVVAIKRLHTHLAQDRYFREMFLTEARVAARVRHPNVVQTFDVVAMGDDVSLVMEYVQGESLAWLQRESAQRGVFIPLNVAASIVVNMLHGLHAAHEACDERGRALQIVHRDVSPQNVMVGADGVARVFDFGVARALQSAHQTRAGQVKGKVSYMAPEQIRATALDRRADIFSAGIVLWELLCGQRLFHGPTDATRMLKVIEGNYPSPLTVRSELPPSLAAVCMKALAYSADGRFASALDFADALEGVTNLASQRAVGEWLTGMAADSLTLRAELVKQVETSDVYPSLSALVTEASGPFTAASTSAPASIPLTPANPTKPPLPRSTLLAGALAVASALIAFFVFAVGQGKPATGAAASVGAALPSPPSTTVSRDRELPAGTTAAAPLPPAPATSIAVEVPPTGNATAKTAPKRSQLALKPTAPKPAAPKPAAPKPTAGARSFRPTEL